MAFETLDTTSYDGLPVGVLVLEPLYDARGDVADYLIRHANPAFADGWARATGSDGFVGRPVFAGQLLDDAAREPLARCLGAGALPFSAHSARTGKYLHFVPGGTFEQGLLVLFVTDVTDHGREVARERFLRGVELMGDVAVLMRDDGNGSMQAVFATEGFARMMECSVERAKELMSGPGFLDTTLAEDRPLVRSMLKRRCGPDGRPDLTIQKTTDAGRTIWCDVHYAFIDDFQEHYVYCTYHDVTMLKEYEQRLRGAYVSLGNNFYVDDDKTLGLFRVNVSRDLIEDVSGRDLLPSDRTGRPYSSALRERARRYPDDAERERLLSAFDPQALLALYTSGKVSTSLILFCERPVGSCYVNVSANLTRHPMTGDVVAFITERTCNSEKVSETLISKILAQQFDMVCYLVDGSYGVVIGDSASAGRGNIFPLTRHGDYERYLNDQVLPVLAGSDEQRASMARALSLDSVEQGVRDREPYIVDIACEIDGEQRFKRFEFFSADPGQRFYILLKSDTTEIMVDQIERNRQLADALDEARQASVAKTVFLSRMSHEIRTPMNAIIGLDTIALAEPGLTPELRTHLDKIGVSAHYLLALINDILDMSRIESGRMALRNEDFSFGEFLEQVNAIVYSQCADRGLTYHCNVHGSVDERYIGDAMKLQQVLLNILGNAVKFTQSGGSVSLDVERTARTETTSMLRFVASDTGIGMDPEFIPKIFTPFSQEDASSTTSYGGTGLGMAITKNIVGLMNGDIRVESVKGSGSTFTIDVMLANADPYRIAQDGDEVAPSDMKVLVVDDDPVALKHARIVLEQAGISVETCLDGDEALEKVRLRHARRDAYNLILVDLRMPGRDGVEVSRLIRSVIGNESAIIILTAYSWADVEDEALAAGVDSFLAKPLFVSGIMREFHAARRRRREQEAAPQAAELEGRRVLLAEDVAINAEIVKQLLAMRGVRVDCVENGLLAVQAIRDARDGLYDAVLMDVRMPVMDGLAATQAIRALDSAWAKNLPIIAMTANAFDEDVQRSLHAGMDAHLSKPVEPERLFDTLSSLIAKHEARRP